MEDPASWLRRGIVEIVRPKLSAGEPVTLTDVRKDASFKDMLWTNRLGRGDLIRKIVEVINGGASKA